MMWGSTFAISAISLESISESLFASSAVNKEGAAEN